MKIQRTTLEYWALIAEITGAVAIVASVIYLGVQIRANTKAVRRSRVYLVAKTISVGTLKKVLTAFINIVFLRHAKEISDSERHCNNT